jgi:plasmid stability protein
MHDCYHDIMVQLTLRVDEALAQRLKATAAEQGRSVNSYATAVLRAAVDPALAGDEVERMRARLAQAGLLAAAIPVAERPEEAAVRRARRRAGQGRPLSDLVSEGRD